eukprot:3468310-Pleurochrysis_carterae.AAC.1
MQHAQSGRSSPPTIISNTTTPSAHQSADAPTCGSTNGGRQSRRKLAARPHHADLSARPHHADLSARPQHLHPHLSSTLTKPTKVFARRYSVKSDFATSIPTTTHLAVDS